MTPFVSQSLRPYAPPVPAFTLIELMVTLSILGFLAAILLPGLSRAREQARISACQSNVRQIALANDLYSMESGGMYCPGARDIRNPVDGNLHRWHGERDSIYDAFDSSRGPLVPTIGPEGTIRKCPSFEPDKIDFELGTGGYGYNNSYVGVQSVGGESGEYHITTDQAGAYADRVKRPAETIMFTDAALVSGELIEYSFAEPRFHPGSVWRPDPSIHFRHHKVANVAWCDGHVSREKRTFTWSSGVYKGDPARYDIGWFGRTDDNSLFDLW